MGGKPKTVGEKKRAKRGRPRKEGVVRAPDGRVAPNQAGTQARRQSAQRAALEARCRLMGWPVNRDTLAEAAAPHLGCNAGRAIHAAPDREDLWEAVKRIRAVYARYWATLGLPNPFPQSATLAALPEPLGTDGVEVDQGSVWDDRPIEERARAATAAMMHLEGVLLRVSADSEVKAVVLRDEAVGDRVGLISGLTAVMHDGAGH